MSYKFQKRADLSGVVGSKRVIASTIGSTGEACLLLVDAQYEKVPFGQQEHKGFAIFPRTKPSNVYPATFVRFDGSTLQRSELPEVDLAYPSVQPLPNDEILIVGGRCDFRNGTPEQNGAVYRQDGNLIQQFVVGDGIEDVQASESGDIWVSYFDEGVFGNFGWTKPIGSSGLVCFDRQGRMKWQYEPPPGMDSIADCYAMNLAADAVWACYYTKFPLIKVSGGKVQAWKNHVSGASALAVDGSRVLLWGGYSDKRCRCVLQSFGRDALTDAKELSVSFPAGIDPLSTRVRGRGSELHAFAEDSWLVFRMDSI